MRQNVGLEFVRSVKFFGASYVCPDGRNTKAILKNDLTGKWNLMAVGGWNGEEEKWAQKERLSRARWTLDWLGKPDNLT